MLDIKNKRYNYILSSILLFLVVNVNISYGQPTNIKNLEGLKLEVWLRSDLLVNSASPTSFKWNDESDSQYRFQQNYYQTGTVIKTDVYDKIPTVNVKSLNNFHPVVDFVPTDRLSILTPVEEDKAMKLVSNKPFNYDPNRAYYTFIVSEPENTNRGLNSGDAAIFAFNSNGDYLGSNEGLLNSGNPLMSLATGTSLLNKSYMWNTDDSKSDKPQARGGIFSFMNPNRSTSNSVKARIRWNGIESLGNFYGEMSSNTKRVGNAMILGNSSKNDSDDPFYGSISEIIVFSGNVNTVMSANNLDKIYSYLAIKYGYTLAPNKDFVNSEGKVIFSRDINKGYSNNVFGIGFDEAFKLDQKQSKSKGSSSLAIFAGNSNKSLNRENKFSFANDKTFLLLGSNISSDYTRYYYNKGTEFSNNKVLGKDIRYIAPQKWKAQLTGQESMTNLAIQVRSSDVVGVRCILVSDDESFAKDKTRLYELDKDNLAKDVIINNGDYLAFGVYLEAPAGIINGLRLWLRADKKSSLTIVDGIFGEEKTRYVTEWKDQSIFKNNYTSSAVSTSLVEIPARPIYTEVDSLMNFYPSLGFNGNNFLAIEKGPMSVNAPDNFTSCVVFNDRYPIDLSGLAGRPMYLFGFGGTNPKDGETSYPSIGVDSPGQGLIKYDEGATSFDRTPMEDRYNRYEGVIQMLNTSKYKGLVTPGFFINEFNGKREKVESRAGVFKEPSNFGTKFKMKSGGTIGGAGEPLVTSNYTFIGLMTEMLFYERDLNEKEQEMLKTYLGLKYGLTLSYTDNKKNIITNFNYKLSNDSLAWAARNSDAKEYSFNNKVAGIVRDDTLQLFNNIARSSATNAMVTISLLEHKENGQGEKSYLTNDCSSLVWGENNSSSFLDLRKNNDVCDNIQIMTNRLWLVNKTNMDSQRADIAIGNNDYFKYANKEYHLYLMVSTDKDAFLNKDFSKIVSIPMKYNKNDFKHHVEYEFNSKYTYFAIGVKEAYGDCKLCDFSGVKTLWFSNRRNSHFYFERPLIPSNIRDQRFNLGEKFTTNINIDLNSSLTGVTAFRTNYPRASSRNSLRESRKLATYPEMVTTISFAKQETANKFTPTSASASFQIFHIDRAGRNRLNKVKIYGICGGVKVRPILSYFRDPRRSSYVIDESGEENLAKAKRRPTSSYGGAAGKMYVDFENPVEEIKVVQNSGLQMMGRHEIGISPIDMLCPLPLPSPIDGFVFTQQAPNKVLLCNEVTYTFRIYNTECNEKYVDFSNILPEGMVWMNASLSLDINNSRMSINDYAEDRELSIKQIKIGRNKTLIFRATAVFEEGASAKVYESQARLDYEVVDEGKLVKKWIPSCDRLTPGCTTTKTTAIFVDNRPKPLSCDFSVAINNSNSRLCYNEEDEISVIIKLNNENGRSYENVDFSLAFDEEFSYIDGSFSSPSPSAFVRDPEDEDGELTLSNLTIVPGLNIIKFKLKAPVEKNLSKERDENDVVISDNVYPLDFTFEFDTEEEEDCMATVFYRANGEETIPYCKSLNVDKIVSNRPITSIIQH